MKYLLTLPDGHTPAMASWLLACAQAFATRYPDRPSGRGRLVVYTAPEGWAVAVWWTHARAVSANWERT